MAEIDYTGIFEAVTNTETGAGGVRTNAIFFSFPFRDTVFNNTGLPGAEFNWGGAEGFNRFIDAISPRAVIGYQNNGKPILADNINYIRSIVGPGNGGAILNIGTLCNPVWVGTMSSGEGFNPRLSYWIRFTDDLENLITGTQDTENELYQTYTNFYDFDNAIDGEDWGNNTIVDWAFRNENTGWPSKVITGDIIRSNYELAITSLDQNNPYQKFFWVAYPFAEPSPEANTQLEYGFRYPDQLFSQITGTGIGGSGALYDEDTSSWVGSMTHLEPGQGYIVKTKDIDNLDTAILTQDNDNIIVQPFVDSYVTGAGVPWQNYTAILGGQTYRASDYSLNEVRGNNYNELTTFPEAFAGFVNWGKHDGVWNPDSLPTTNIEECKRWDDEAYLTHNGILNYRFENIYIDNANRIDSFVFMGWWDPYRSEHFIGAGYRMATHQTTDQGFCGNALSDCLGTEDVDGHYWSSFGADNHFTPYGANDVRLGTHHMIIRTDSYCHLTAGELFIPGWSDESAYWCQGEGGVSNPNILSDLHPQYQKQRSPMKAGVNPTGFDLKAGPHMAWTWVLYHHPSQRFYQLRPAHVRYKILLMINIVHLILRK